MAWGLKVRDLCMIDIFTLISYVVFFEIFRVYESNTVQISNFHLH